ncbi:MAG: CoA transferase, partial [Candidatus Entotheonellia bacterium]
MDGPVEGINRMPGPLEHIKVIDLTRARSGPTCVRQLGDMGAQVI